MILQKQLLINTKPTLNNRVYPIEVLESIRDQINSRDKSTNLGTLGYPEGLEVSLSEAAFQYSNAIIEGDSLYVDIETIHTPEGIYLRRMIDEGNELRFRPGGQSTLKGVMPVETHNLLGVPKHVAMDYQLITISLINPDEDALNL